MTKYAQQAAPAPAGGGNLIGWVPTIGAAWEDCPNGYGGAGSFFKFDGTPYWKTTEWEMNRIPTNSGNADGPVEGTFTPDGDDWIMSVFMRCQVDGQRYQLTLSGSSGNSWISLESGAGGFPGTVVATTPHGLAAGNRGTHTIKLTATGTGFVGSLNGTPFISGTNATLAAVGYPGQGGRSVIFRSLDADDTTAAGPILTGTATLDDITAGGGLTSAAPSTLSGGATLEEVAASGGITSAPVVGTFTSESLRWNNDTVEASVALTWLSFRNIITGAVVLNKTGVSTNSLGVFSVADALLVPGTALRADWKTADGHHGWGIATPV